ncbi:MAG: hypothetical protein HYW85_06870 [Deltaproteobacteria bacterium]|nr:hypothetical protein [Deltaproteobacteria bacterium]
MIEGSKEVKTIQAPKDLLTTMTSGVQTQAPQLENVRKDMEKAILTAHPADISFAVSNLLDLLEEWPIAWELMPEEFKDEETLVSTLTDVITRAQQLHMTDQILKFIETQFDPSNAASLLNQSRYEKVTAPHLVIKKKLEHTTVYTGWINGSLKLWLGGEEI